MLLYHATPKENLEGILAQGILPKVDFLVFNGQQPVIWMASRPDIALINAFDMDYCKKKFGIGNEDLCERYAVLHVDVSYIPHQKATHRENIYWVFQTIEPQNIIHVQEESADTAALVATFL